MVAQNPPVVPVHTRPETETEIRRRTASGDGAATVFGLIGGALFCVAHVSAAMLFANAPGAAWAVLTAAWLAYPPVLAFLMWTGAASRPAN